jgi:hypothetical protein
VPLPVCLYPKTSSKLLDEYLRSSTKPYNTLLARLGVINSISVYLHDSTGNRLFTNNNSKKNPFYRLMFLTWQLAFDVRTWL